MDFTVINGQIFHQELYSFRTLKNKVRSKLEVEFALIVRLKTKRWSDFQNGIHFNFNNSFVPPRQLFAKKIYIPLTR